MQLSESEKKDIVRAVLTAKSPKEQRVIEAELRGTSLKIVDAVLKDAGICLVKPPQRRGGRTAKIADEVIIQMAKDGTPVKEIARQTGYSSNSIYRKIQCFKERELEELLCQK